MLVAVLIKELRLELPVSRLNRVDDLLRRDLAKVGVSRREI